MTPPAHFPSPSIKTAGPPPLPTPVPAVLPLRRQRLSRPHISFCHIVHPSFCPHLHKPPHSSFLHLLPYSPLPPPPTLYPSHIPPPAALSHPASLPSISFTGRISFVFYISPDSRFRFPVPTATPTTSFKANPSPVPLRVMTSSLFQQPATPKLTRFFLILHRLPLLTGPSVHYLTKELAFVLRPSRAFFQLLSDPF